MTKTPGDEGTRAHPQESMPTRVNQRAIAAHWKDRGFSCDLWIDPPGRVWTDFVHEVDELVMVVQGRVEFEIDGVRHLPELGEELLIPARALHTVRNVGSAESRWLYGYKR